MKIVSLNANGIRAAGRKGFAEWVPASGADIVCLQEVKARQEQLPTELTSVGGYSLHMSQALKPGYSGVAVYARQDPLNISRAIGLKRFDEEGRIIELEYPDFTIVNVYMPHGGRKKENLSYKLEAYKYLFARLDAFKERNVVLIGDFNIAHRDIDLARPKSNQDNIMFTPEERGQIDSLLALGFIDTFRQLHQDGGHYTWWPYAFGARDRNIGWRIDYAFVSCSLAGQLKESFILPDAKFSDHCPIGLGVEL